MWYNGKTNRSLNVNFAMFHKRALLSKSFATYRTYKRPITSMGADMVFKYKCCRESFRTKLAPEWRNTSMHDHSVALQIRERGKPAVTLATFIFLVIVHPIVLDDTNVHVAHIRTEIVETSFALWTRQ